MTYGYTWHEYLATQRRILASTLDGAGENIESLKEKIKNATVQSVYDGLTQKAQEQGLSINVVNVNVEVTHTEETIIVPPAIYGIPMKAYRVQVNINADFESDRELIGSPIAPALIIIIKWVIDAIVLIVIAYFTIEAIKQAIEEFVKSLTTQTSTITKTTTTTKHNDDCTTTTTTTQTTESTTKPSWEGILTVGVVAIVMLVVVFILWRWRRR